MSVSRVLLGVLAEGPAHGYDLKHAHDDRFPGARPLAFGQVYAALAKLEKDGLVEIVETGREAGPDRMTYALTAAGRRPSPLARRRRAGGAVRRGRPGAQDRHRPEAGARRGRVPRRPAAGAPRCDARLLELQTSTDDVAARIVIDHTVEHLDADLRWLENAAARVDSSTPDRRMRA